MTVCLVTTLDAKWTLCRRPAEGRERAVPHAWAKHPARCERCAASTLGQKALLDHGHPLGPTGKGSGRPVEQDAEQRALGRIPASEAAALVKRHISRLYRKREAGQLPMVRVGSYWYVTPADLARAFPTTTGGA